MGEQDPKKRAKNFDEVALGYTLEEALEEANRCILCGKCKAGCPVEVDIPEFIKCLKEKDFKKALDVMKRDNSLPGICGRVCPQESQCEKDCVLGVKDESVAIGRLERFIADYWGDKEAPVGKPEPSGKKVAVVGSGPAGLTCAGDLVKMGHQVKVFESLHEPGGVLVYGIPPFRLPRDVLHQELEYIKALGVDIQCNTVVGLTRTLEELREEFDAVFIGTGAGLPYFLGIPGEQLNGVYSANEFLIRVNMMHADRFPGYDTPVKVGKRVAVVGAGNVAMDSARVALRLGASEVFIVYRRSRKEMPAREEEIVHAEEEGINFNFLTNSVEVLGEYGVVTGLKCVRMQLGEPDSSGRRRPEPIPNSEFELKVDSVVIAIGQGPNPLLTSKSPGLEVDDRGKIKVVNRESGETNLEGVYAGGDIVTGAATVIGAMGAGKQAAKAIHEYLIG